MPPAKASPPPELLHHQFLRESFRSSLRSSANSKGSFNKFKHAWIDMVVEHLNDQRLRENRLYTAITGKDVPGLDEHQLPARRKSP
jgi:hypothetical protein